MRHFHPSVLGFLSLATITLLGSCNQDETAFGPQDLQSFPSGISGRVVDRHGHSLPGALVTVLPSGTTTVSGPDGSFSLTNLATGSYQVAIAKDDYRDTLLLDAVKLGLSETRQVGSLGIGYRYATISGVVVDSAGNVLPTAGIAVENQTSTAMAVSEGKFLLGRVEPGKVRLFSAFEGRGYGVLDTVLRPDDTLRGVRLKINRNGGDVVGRVVDSVGTGVANAKVQTMGGALHTTTDTNGSFKLTHVPGEGKVALEVTKGDLSTTVTGVHIPEGGQTKVDLISMQPKPKDSVSVRPGTVMGTMSDSVVTLVATVLSSDTSFHIYRYLWKLSETAAWEGTGTSTVDIRLDTSGWHVGTNIVRVKLSAIDGRKSVDAILTIRLKDVKAPVIQTLSPRDTTYAFGDSSVTVRWSVTDDVKVDTVWIDNLPQTFHGGLVSKTFTLPLGTTTVQIKARDSSGNVAQDSVVLRRFTVKDIIRPTITRLQPQDTTVSAMDSVVTLNWLVSDDRQLDSVKINNTVRQIVHPGTTPIKVPDTSPVTVSDTVPYGVSKVTLWVWDHAGNMDSSIVNITRMKPDSSTALATLSADIGKLSPSFHGDTLVYVDSVDAGVDSVRFTRSTASPNASIRDSNGVAGRFAVKSDTTLWMVVENGQRLRTYTIRIYHRPEVAFGIPWQTVNSYQTIKVPQNAADSQIYKTIQIGTQVWMAENLNTKVDSSWSYQDNSDSGKKYGRLYTWAAAMALNDSCDTVSCAAQINKIHHQGICPTDWHLPDTTEWNQLVNEVGGKTIADQKLKSTSGWAPASNVLFAATKPNGQDLVGFRALPSGFRDSAGTYQNAGQSGSWWSASPKLAPESKTNSNSQSLLSGVYLLDISNRIPRVSTDKRDGLSVRCLKD